MENLERRLHVSELLYEAFQRVEDCSHHYIHSCKVAASRKVKTEELENAFRVLIHYQVRLHTRIEKREEDAVDLWYCDMEEKDHSKFKVPMTEENVNSFDEWPGIVDRDGKLGFDLQNGPLWRVILLRIFDTDDFGMIFIMHHAISDAKSVFDMIYRQFLPILSHIINSEAVPDSFLEPIPPCPTAESASLPFEEAEKLGRDTSFFINLVCRFAEWKSRRMSPEDRLRVTLLNDRDGIIELSNYTNIVEMVPYSYSVELTSALSAAAKAHKVTVHSALLVATTGALAKIRQRAGKSVPRKFKLGWPICHRSKAGIVSPQPLGVVVGNGMADTPARLETEPEVFWQDVTKVTTKVRKQMPKPGTGLTRMDKFIFSFLGIAIKRALENGGNPLGPFSGMMPAMGAGISNLGLCEANGPEPKMSDGSSKVELQEQYFGIDGMFGEVFGGAANFMTVNTFRGQLRWTLCIGKQFISRELALELMRETEEIIKAVCEVDSQPKEIEN